MAIAVVHTDGDQPEARAERSIERRALVRRAVVGDLHQIDRTDRAGGEQCVLRLLSEVAEEDRADAPPLGLEREAARVAGVHSCGCLTGPRRPEESPSQLPETTGESRVALLDRNAGRTKDAKRPLVGIAHRALDDGALRPGRDTGHSPDVVRIEVGEEQEVQPGDAEAVEAGGRRLRLPPDVDHADRIPVAQQESVTLADIAGRNLPIGRDREGAASDASAQGADIDDGTCAQRHDRRRRHRARCAPGQDEHGHGDEDPGAQQDAEQSRCPGKYHTREAAGEGGHLCDPGRRNPREPDDRIAEARRPRKHGAGQAPEDRRQGCGGLRQQVRRYPEERDDRRQEDEDRLARQLSRSGNGHGQRERAWHPAGEHPAERTGQHEQARGRQGGESETVVPGEPGIVDHEHDQCEGEGRHAVGRTPARQSDEEHRRHRGGPDDARARSDERHEAQQGKRGGDDPCATAEPDEARQSEDQSDHQGAVRAGHRCEMTER